MAHIKKTVFLGLALGMIGFGCGEAAKPKTPKVDSGSSDDSAVGKGGSGGSTARDSAVVDTMTGTGGSTPDMGGGRGGAGGMGMGGAGTGGAGGAATGGMQMMMAMGGRPADAGVDSMPADAGSVATSGPWNASAIGAAGMGNMLELVTVAGDNQTFKITAGGTDIGGMADSFYFASQKVSGDVEITARLGTIDDAPDAAAKAGVMFRASNAPGAANVLFASLGDSAMGGRLQFRKTTGGATDATMLDPGLRTGTWLRLRREGNKFTAARSANRVNWFTVGEVVLDGFPAEAMVGFATESHKADATRAVVINALRLNNFFTTPATSAWVQDEFGTVGSSALLATGNKLNLVSWGQPWTLGDKDPAMNMGGRDFFQYVYRLADARDTSMVVRIDSLSNGDPASRVGLMVRENTSISSMSRSAPFAMISVTAGSGVEFHSRALPAGAMMTPGIAVGKTAASVKAPVWLKLSRVGQEITGSYSQDGNTWTKLDSATMVYFSDNPAVGIAHTSWNAATLSSATTSNFWIGTGTPPAAPDAGPVVTVDAGTVDASAVDAVSVDAVELDAAAGN